ncbi:unnamed protein product, partial [Candidula unifasciata]
MSSETIDTQLEPENAAADEKEAEAEAEELDDEEVESTRPSVMSLQNVEDQAEDVTLSMSASIKDIYKDMEPPLQSRSVMRITTDAEDAILKN